MQSRTKKLRRIYYIFWFLLIYIIAALVFWYISLEKQNETIEALKLNQLDPASQDYVSQKNNVEQERFRKSAQYMGEGVIFFLVIIAGAGFIFRAVRRQLRQSVQQQNFMMGITHELKTPIAVSQLNLETLKKHNLDEERKNRLLDATLRETIRLDSLCNNMLLVSQIDAGGYRLSDEDLDLSSLAEECVNGFTGRYPERNISTMIEPRVHTRGDSLLWRIAINNLVDNALKYSGKQGAVEVKLVKDGNVVNLSIADNGIGIKGEDKKRVFEKFYRAGDEATKAAKGTGLGLYLTERVVKAHKGKIIALDNKPAGTIFLITLMN